MPWTPNRKTGRAFPKIRASKAPQPIGSEAWKAQVVNAVATEPVKRTPLQRRVITEADAFWAAEDTARPSTTH
jgi:hypothetical protein